MDPSAATAVTPATLRRSTRERSTSSKEDAKETNAALRAKKVVTPLPSRKRGATSKRQEAEAKKKSKRSRKSGSLSNDNKRGGEKIKKKLKRIPMKDASEPVRTGERVSVLYPDKRWYDGTVTKCQEIIEINVKYCGTTDEYGGQLEQWMDPNYNPEYVKPRTVANPSSAEQELEDDDPEEKTPTKRPRRRCATSSSSPSNNNSSSIDVTAVDTPVSVYWTKDQRYHDGIVCDKRDAHEIYVEFDDGDKSWVNPNSHKVARLVVVDSLSATSSSASSKEKRKQIGAKTTNVVSAPLPESISDGLSDDVTMSETDSPLSSGPDDKPSAAEEETNNYKDFPVGSQVQVYWQGEGKAFSGVVTRHYAGLIHVKYADGDEKWTYTPDERVKLISPPPESDDDLAAAVPPDAATGNRAAVPPPPSTPSAYKVGDRIEVYHRDDNEYYGGGVRKVHENGVEVEVEYDDDSPNEWVFLSECRPGGPFVPANSKDILDKVKRGSFVEVWWPADKQFFTAVVQNINRRSKLYTLLYDDDGHNEEIDLEHRPFNLVAKLDDPIDLSQQEEDALFCWHNENDDDAGDSNRDIDFEDEGRTSQQPEATPVASLKEIPLRDRVFVVGNWYYSPKSHCYYKIEGFKGIKNPAKVLCEKLAPIEATFIGKCRVGPKKKKEEIVYVQWSKKSEEKVAFLRDLKDALSRNIPKPKYVYAVGTKPPNKFHEYTVCETPASPPQLPDGDPPVGLDLFAGVGGSSRGMEEAGISVKYLVENSPLAASSLRKIHPGAMVYEEDANLFLTRAENCQEGYPTPTDVHHLHASPPCQGYSRANRNGGSDDESNRALTLCFIRGVKVLSPLTATMENVMGILHERHKQQVENILWELLHLGYNVRLAVHDASDYGVPQTRRRVFIYAFKAGLAVPPLLNPCGKARRTVSQALQDLKSKPADEEGCGIVSLKGCGRVTNHTVALGGMTESVKLKGNEPAPTLTTSVIFRHPELDRNLTHREYARLQTFPDCQAFSGASCQIRKQIGNAVPVKLSRAVSEAVMECYPRTSET